MVRLLGLHAESFTLGLDLQFELFTYGWKLVLLGIIFGFVGALFERTMHFAHHFFEKEYPNDYVSIIVGAIGVGLLLWLL